jgi:hypothetical protein
MVQNNSSFSRQGTCVMHLNISVDFLPTDEAITEPPPHQIRKRSLVPGTVKPQKRWKK